MILTFGKCFYPVKTSLCKQMPDSSTDRFRCIAVSLVIPILFVADFATGKRTWKDVLEAYRSI